MSGTDSHPCPAGRAESLQDCLRLRGPFLCFAWGSAPEFGVGSGWRLLPLGRLAGLLPFFDPGYPVSPRPPLLGRGEAEVGTGQVWLSK